MLLAASAPASASHANHLVHVHWAVDVWNCRSSFFIKKKIFFLSLPPFLLRSRIQNDIGLGPSKTRQAIRIRKSRSKVMYIYTHHEKENPSTPMPIKQIHVIFLLFPFFPNVWTIFFGSPKGKTGACGGGFCGAWGRVGGWRDGSEGEGGWEG